MASIGRRLAMNENRYVKHFVNSDKDDIILHRSGEYKFMLHDSGNVGIRLGFALFTSL
jgi:hypothetical protein